MIPIEMVEAFKNMVNKSPGISRRAIAESLMDIDPRWCSHIFKTSVGKTLTKSDIAIISRAPTIAKAKALYEQFVRNRSNEFSIDSKVMSNVKRKINKTASSPDDVIYGSPRGGYRTIKNMSSKDLLSWMCPRLNQIGGERLHWTGASKALIAMSVNKYQKEAASNIDKYVNTGLLKENTSILSEKAKEAFLKKLSK